MKKFKLLIALSLLSLSVFLMAKEVAPTKTPYQIIADAHDSDWRDLNLENTLYIQLKSGLVVVEMAPQFAPNHVENTKKLVREGVFDNTSFYRVIDGFVAQGGPVDRKEITKAQKGKLLIDAEFTITPKQPFVMTPLNGVDGYADVVGYLDGFAMGKSKNKNWLLHCYGAFGMGRGNQANTGGIELYIVIGTAQRYLDRNTTVFGRVISGMQNIQALRRSTTLNGEIDVKKDNKIIKVQVASDLKPKQLIKLQIMKTDSDSFRALIKSRKNRNSEWFVHQHNYIDVCSVAVPVRLKN